MNNVKTSKHCVDLVIISSSSFKGVKIWKSWDENASWQPLTHLSFSQVLMDKLTWSRTVTFDPGLLQRRTVCGTRPVVLLVQSGTSVQVSHRAVDQWAVTSQRITPGEIYRRGRLSVVWWMEEMKGSHVYNLCIWMYWINMGLITSIDDVRGASYISPRTAELLIGTSAVQIGIFWDIRICSTD